MRVIYEALVSKDERGDFCAAIPTFDVVTEGDGFADAVFMAHDLIQMLVSEYLKDGRSLPEARFASEGEIPKGTRSVAIAVDCEKIGELETMTAAEAAEMLGVTRARIYALVSDGLLRSVKIGGARLITTESVRARFNALAAAGNHGPELSRAGNVSDEPVALNAAAFA